MKYSTLLASCLLLLAVTPVLADGGSCPASPDTIRPTSHEVDETLLFLTLPELRTKASTVTFTLLVDGEVFAVEHLSPRWSEASEGAVVLEVLGHEAEMRNAFLSAGLEGRAEIQVALGERRVRTLSLDELLSLSREYRESLDSVAPTRADSTLEADAELLRRTVYKTTPCEDQCYQQYPCVPNGIGGFNCTPGLVPCLEACDDCSPSSETVVESSLYSITAVGPSECFYDFGFARVYDWTRIRYKYERKRIDTAADCSVTETILEVWYQDNYCYYPGTVIGCYGPTTKYNVCF